MRDYTGNKIPIGRDETGELFEVNLKEPRSVLAQAIPGQGKTMLLKNYLVAALRMHEAGDEVQVVVLDPEGQADRALFQWLKPAAMHPVFDRVIWKPSDFQAGRHLDVMEGLLAEANDRAEHGMTADQPHLLVVIDEVTKLCQLQKHGKRFLELYRSLLNSIKTGMTIVGSGQMVSSRSLGSADIKHMAQAHVVFRLSQSLASQVLPVGGRTADGNALARRMYLE